MKNIILASCAAFSMTLSLFFEHTPTDKNTKLNSVETASVLSLDFPTSSLLTCINVPSLNFKDTLYYNYYAQTLGVRLNYSEDKHLLATVADWLGTPYRSGAASRQGTDCSGFVSKVYKEVYGITLVHSSRSMFQSVEHIKKSAIKAGDLVFFRRGPGKPIYHVGIYLNNNKFIHSASNGGVMVSSLNQSYYARNYYAAGRVNL
ncbi:C40 family peptidase [Adhaeribacter pallidiroseus]|uniref:Putative endopeptidase NlpC like protein n=1 Tax=Adhaeribacter pallidiroseus TaxID=2072847 RepID=A0A369QB77_9BACT|nr:C40 family peptidase [Adhaeribacter pallidiroseus]RDC61712.1 putative endopeptidase NlpC like protein [Adhaeribacter pallidiroseus]